MKRKPLGNSAVQPPATNETPLSPDMRGILQQLLNQRNQAMQVATQAQNALASYVGQCAVMLQLDPNAVTLKPDLSAFTKK